MRWGLDDVTVRLGGRVAIIGVTLPVEPASVTVVVGGDGAGKSTCLRALVGLVGVEEGSVRRPSKSKIGYVPATAGLYADLTVDENVAFSATAYGLSGAELKGRAGRILGLVGLDGVRDRLGGQLSGGMQRKLAVGMALVHSPELLVLDEPTTGVDPVSRAELWRLISRAGAEGTAVVVATTYVNEAARGSAAMLLEEGRVLISGAPEGIVGEVPGTLGRVRGVSQPTAMSWRRGADWRVWAPTGDLPPGVTRVDPDLEDAAVIAALASEMAVSS